jgi:hypothetical protein
VILLIILVSVLPVILEVIKNKRSPRLPARVAKEPAPIAADKE